MTTFHAEHIRSQFPSLSRKADDGTPIIYLDNPAGTQVPQVVIDAVQDYYQTMNANAGGYFATSQDTDAMVESVREKMADFLNAPSSQEIVFGPNMTTLNFSLSRAIGKILSAGDQIILTKMDHDANIAPWLAIADDYDLTIKWVDIIEEDCTLDLNSFESALTDRTKVVATVHASNAVGTINPIQQIGAMAHAAGAYFVVDAVQSAPHIPIDVQAIGCDFLLCSAYKFFGPHIGILWGKFDLLEQLPAYKVRPAKDITPHRWETGTQSFETINAVGSAIDYLAKIGLNYGVGEFDHFIGNRLNLKWGMTAIVHYEQKLIEQLIDGLQSIPSVSIAGIIDPDRYYLRVPTVAFVMENHTADEIAQHLANNHIYVWSGNYYALEIMDRLGHAEHGMVRVGIAHYNTEAEIQRLLNVLSELI